MVIEKLFFMPKSISLAEKVSIKSPKDFKESIRRLNKKGLTDNEKKALILAQNRAIIQLSRKDLSDKERKEFQDIRDIKLTKKLR